MLRNCYIRPDALPYPLCRVKLFATFAYFEMQDACAAVGRVGIDMAYGLSAFHPVAFRYVYCIKVSIYGQVVAVADYNYCLIS